MLGGWRAPNQALADPGLQRSGRTLFPAVDPFWNLCTGSSSHWDLPAADRCSAPQPLDLGQLIVSLRQAIWQRLLWQLSVPIGCS